MPEGKELRDEEIVKEGYRAVIERLGLEGFSRFVRLTQGGRGNWTEEREKVLKEFNQMGLDELNELILKNTKGPEKGQKVVK